MKQINQYIRESILDDEDDIIQNDDFLIEKWLKDNYKIIGSYSIENKVISVSGHVAVKNKNITQLLPDGYSFGKILRDFNCSLCVNLVSLNGSPEEVAGVFDCAGCSKLTTLEGAPTVVLSLNCNGCRNLTSLKGCPEYIPGSLFMGSCSKLKSLNHIAKNIRRDLYCYGCGKVFEESYIITKTNVGGNIINK